MISSSSSSTTTTTTSSNNNYYYDDYVNAYKGKNDWRDDKVNLSRSRNTPPKKKRSNNHKLTSQIREETYYSLKNHGLLPEEQKDVAKEVEEQITYNI